MTEWLDWAAFAMNAFPSLPATLVSWIGGALAAMGIVQSAKQTRKTKDRRPYNNMELRALAFLVASHITFLIAYKLFGEDFDVAVTHGVLSGVLTPWVAAVIIATVRARSPKVVDAARDPYNTDNYIL
jgi:glucose uptake protein GlcU